MSQLKYYYWSVSLLRPSITPTPSSNHRSLSQLSGQPAILYPEKRNPRRSRFLNLTGENYS